MTLTIVQDETLPEPSRRASLLRGEVHPLRPSTASALLGDALRAALYAALPEAADPRMAQHIIAPEELFTRIRRLRTWLAQGPLNEYIRALLEFHGCDLSLTYFDAIRLRAVTSDGHQNPAAAPAYYPHRDTWYANPQCQINWWMPLFDITRGQAMGFFPSYWANPIQNDSVLFDYDEFTHSGGWQAYGGGIKATQQHPTNQEPIKEAPVQLARKKDSLLLFSGAHLHATIPHSTNETRFSVEFRTFHLEDLQSGRGAPNVDNASRGSTARDFLRAKDFTPYQPSV